MDGVVEVLHARFGNHAYPLHTHAAWTLMILDRGSVRSELGRHEIGIVPRGVTLLPPHVAHDGRAGTAGGFVKRVLYLAEDTIDTALVGAAVDRPTLHDPALRRQLDGLHRSIEADPGGLETASRLALVSDRISEHLRPSSEDAAGTPAAHALALRDLIDANVVPGIDLADAAAGIGVSRAHLIKAFTSCWGLPPHRYLIGRRIDLARRLLLEGRSVADVAVAAGFYDQAHLHRHMVRMLGVPPARYARPRRTLE
ncbi:MAG: AraC family transcriptional regulator [Nocardioidaceae bacterium]|nr:AraC family transcriptional regulator [Nocardioidaceae bacterium]